MANKLYSFLVTIKSFLTRQLSSQVKVDLFLTLSMLLQGFYGESYVLYDFSKNNPKEYLSDYARFRTRFINNPYNIMLRDKNVFQTIMSPYIDVPRSLGIFRGGQFFPRTAGLSLEKILESLSDSGVIIKPLEGSGGYNVMHLTAEGGDVLLNHERIGRQQLDDRLSTLNKYLVAEYIQQGDYAKKVFPDSTNTIRMVTMVDPATGEPFIATAVHRFGTSKTAPTDNWTQGGLSAKVDVETGILGKAAPFPWSGQLTWHSLHPETEARIEGEIVPNWSGIKEDILSLARNFSYIKYVGWDVVATNSGVKVIEGNNYTDINLLQVHQGLLTDARVVNFYKHYHVI